MGDVVKFKVNDEVIIMKDPKSPTKWNHRFGEICKVIQIRQFAVMCVCSDGVIININTNNLRKLTKLDKALR